MSQIEPFVRRSANAKSDEAPTKPVEEGNLDLGPALSRIERLERRIRFLGVAIIALLSALAYTLFTILPVDPTHQSLTVENRVLESERFSLVDSAGRPRMLIEVYSGVPVLQLFDSTGESRISMGLRFDDTAFIDLSDHRGRTRAAFEVSDEGHPSFKLFDEKGSPTFQVK